MTAGRWAERCGGAFPPPPPTGNLNSDPDIGAGSQIPRAESWGAAAPLSMAVHPLSLTTSTSPSQITVAVLFRCLSSWSLVTLVSVSPYPDSRLASDSHNGILLVLSLTASPLLCFLTTSD